MNWRQFNITDAALLCTCASSWGYLPAFPSTASLSNLLTGLPTPPFSLPPSHTISDSFCLRILWSYSNDSGWCSKLERWLRNADTIYIGHLSFTAVISFHEKFCFMDKQWEEKTNLRNQIGWNYQNKTDLQMLQLFGWASFKGNFCSFESLGKNEVSLLDRVGLHTQRLSVSHFREEKTKMNRKNDSGGIFLQEFNCLFSPPKGHLYSYRPQSNSTFCELSFYWNIRLVRNNSCDAPGVSPVSTSFSAHIYSACAMTSTPFTYMLWNLKRLYHTVAKDLIF